MNVVWPTLKDVFLTFLRWSAGLSIGTILGLIISLLEALVIPRFHGKPSLRSRLITILLDFLRALPIIALVPIIQMISVKETWKIALISWAVMFPVWLAIRQARMRKMIDTEIALAATGLKSVDILRTYQFPKSLGGLLKGVEISIGVAWISVVAAEWVGTFTTGFWAGGLGYKIMRAHDANNWGGMLACLVLFGILGSMTAWIWRYLLYKIKYQRTGFDPMWGHRD